MSSIKPNMRILDFEINVYLIFQLPIGRKFVMKYARPTGRRDVTIML